MPRLPAPPCPRRTALQRRARSALLPLALACACARPHKTATLPHTPPVPQTEFVIRVTNHNYLDVVVYVLHHGQQSRIGMVTGSSSETFIVPARLLSQSGEIQLYGDPVGNDEYALTDILIVQPGQVIEWTLETDLKRSSVAVF